MQCVGGEPCFAGDRGYSVECGSVGTVYRWSVDQWTQCVGGEPCFPPEARTPPFDPLVHGLSLSARAFFAPLAGGTWEARRGEARRA